MCAPSTEAREKVVEIVNDIIPQNGVQCTTTPRGVVDWIKANHPKTWRDIVSQLEPTCGDCDYRIVAAATTIIRDFAGLRFSSWMVKPRVTRVLVSAA